MTFYFVSWHKRPALLSHNFLEFAQVQLLENDRKTKENQISTMEAALEKSKEESTSLEHELGNLTTFFYLAFSFNWQRQLFCDILRLVSCDLC